VTKDHRTPRIDEVYILVSVLIIEIRPFCFFDEQRVPSYGTECSYGRIYTTGNELFCLVEQGFAAGDLVHALTLFYHDQFTFSEGDERYHLVIVAVPVIESLAEVAGQYT
jgi:hypothetical protein